MFIVLQRRSGFLEHSKQNHLQTPNESQKVLPKELMCLIMRIHHQNNVIICMMSMVITIHFKLIRFYCSWKMHLYVFLFASIYRFITLHQQMFLRWRIHQQRNNIKFKSVNIIHSHPSLCLLLQGRRLMITYMNWYERMDIWKESTIVMIIIIIWNPNWRRRQTIYVINQILWIPIFYPWFLKLKITFILSIIWMIQPKWMNMIIYVKMSF